MTTVTKTPVNGKAPATKSNPVKAAQVDKKIEASVKSLRTASTSLDEKLERSEALSALGEKRKHLVEKRSHIKQFQFTGEDSICVLQISDDSGRKFSTSNSDVIEAQISNLENIITSKLLEVELEIIEFEI